MAKSDERDLESRYKLFVSAIESIQDYAIFMLNPEGFILTWNAGAERIEGYTEKEIIGKHFSIFYTPTDIVRKHPQEELDIAKKVGKFEEEGWRVRKNGELFWTSILITKITDENGKLIGYSKLTRDLTERRKSEVVLKTSEERFRQLVEGVKDYAIFLLDPNGVVATWNEGAQRLKGYTAEEIIGHHFSKFYEKEEIEAGKCEYELEEASITGRFEDEGWRKRKDGTRFWANVVITTLRGSTGQVTGFSKVTRDLTERRRAEERLRRANDELEKRVEKRTKELLVAKTQLENAINARDEFLSVASHEIKTPITSLKLYAEMLESQLDVEKGILPKPEKIAKALTSIIRQANRLTHLVESLMDISRANLGKFSFNFEKVNLSELINVSLKEWVEPLSAAHCVLETNVEDNLFAEVDSFRFEQVLANLLSNAIKYASGATIKVSLRAENQMAVLRVHDNGPGIAPHQQARVFDRYERANPTPGVSGFGLGLFILKTIVEAHHGKIELKSELGRGSIFSVYIPMQSAVNSLNVMEIGSESDANC